jgi:hypothetical protein
MKVRWLIGALAGVGMLATQSAFAAPKPPTVVLEAHIGERSADAALVMKPLLAELERYGVVARTEDIEKLLGAQLPLPGVLDEGKTAVGIAQQIDSGLDAFNQTKYTEAEAILGSAVAQIKRNPALLVLDATNAKVTFSALVGLALAQAKLGRAPESVATMTVLLRMSSTPISRAEYGPQVEQFYRTVQKQVQALGRGSLKIAANDGRAMIFLDGQFRGMGKVALADLIPGVHAVFVQVPGSSGRQYEAEVRANDESVLDIDWQVDSALWVSGPWVGFLFASETERAKEARYASALAHRWRGDSIVVVGTTKRKGTPVVIGTVYLASGATARGAFVPMHAGADGLRSLARFLVDGTVSEPLNLFSRGAEEISASPAKTEPVHPRLVPVSGWLAGAGVLAMIGGGAVYAVSQASDTTYCDRRSLALGTVLGGSAALGAGVYWWLRETRASSEFTSVALGAGIASIIAGGTLYLTDEDVHLRGDQRKYYRDTATAGVVFGVAGMAMTGVGVWLWRREGNRAAPVVSVSQTHTELGWATLF